MKFRKAVDLLGEIKNNFLSIANSYQCHLKNYCWIFTLGCLLLSCSDPQKSNPETAEEVNSASLEMNSSKQALVEAFNWAKNKALSYAHDGSDPVGYWYEAALPNREAFCMRDVSHQAIGAEILGLSEHNYNMMLKFTRNISKEKDYCSYWEINRYDLPAPVDYETDKDFWYNLPANFDVIFNSYRLYNWTGNTAYLENPDFKNFYALSLNEYVDHWDLGANEVTDRNRAMHLNTTEGEAKSRFGNNRGIPTYNEGGRGETILGIDMTASLIAAYKAYAKILEQSGESTQAEAYVKKAAKEQQFLDDFWWDEKSNTYRSIWYADKTFDYFMVGDNQAYLHYLYYFDAIADEEKIKSLIADYTSNFDKLIVELKSYLPIMFYENGQTEMANQMIIDLCSADNQRRDYPENSFTVIEHITRGLMGINVKAAENTVSTISRLEKKEDWAEMKNIPLLSNSISVKHFGKDKTVTTNLNGQSIKWRAQIPGRHEFLYVNGVKKPSSQGKDHGQLYSWCEVELRKGEEVTVSVY